MNLESQQHDTLLLVIKEKEGVVSDYQRQLYEASLLGMDRVVYCFIADDFSQNKSSRLEYIRQKIELTCELLNIEPMDISFSMRAPSFLSGSRVIKTNDEGIIIGGVGERFDDYKQKNNNALQQRKRIGYVFAKRTAKTCKTVNVSI